MAGRGVWQGRLLRGLGLTLVFASGFGVGVVTIWVDPEGRALLTDRESPPSPGAVPTTVEALAESWREGSVTGPRVEGSDSSLSEDRLAREVRIALEDLERGETRDALPVLRRLHREHPGHAEVALALADLERRRGRLEVAEEVLEELLTTPAGLREASESRARRTLSEIRQQIEMDGLKGNGAVRREVESPHFRVTYDHRLAGRVYGDRVIRLLEDVRTQLFESLGRTLSRPLEVKLYTRTHYLDAHRSRFPFATVGFFDGAIHLVTARHPQTELHALLAHEYAHALFQEALEGDVPFLLNEGIAERAEAAVRGQPALVRGDWWKLVDAIRSEEWIPLRKLVPGFGGLEGSRALLAYLEARAAVELIEDRRPGAIARWLERCAQGTGWEFSLLKETGWNVGTLDAALRAEVKGRFTADPLPASLGR
jgi:hypothetical protein